MAWVPVRAFLPVGLEDGAREDTGTNVEVQAEEKDTRNETESDTSVKK